MQQTVDEERKKNIKRKEKKKHLDKEKQMTDNFLTERNDTFVEKENKSEYYFNKSGKFPYKLKEKHL